MPGHCRSEALELSPEQAHEGRAVCLRIGFDHVRLHASATRGPSIMGLPVCVRPSSQYLVYLCTTGNHEGNASNKSKVRVRFPVKGEETDGTVGSPTKLLRSFPPLQAKLIVEITVSNLRKIPADIYEELVHHAE